MALRAGFGGDGDAVEPHAHGGRAADLGLGRDADQVVAGRGLGAALVGVVPVDLLALVDGVGAEARQIEHATRLEIAAGTAGERDDRDAEPRADERTAAGDRKSTRLNSSP